MALLGKPLVFYLSRNFLEVFQANSKQDFPFSPEVLRHSEIIDKKKYLEELQKFIEGLKLKTGKGIILLSPELIYASDIDITGKNEQEEIDKFLASLPLRRSAISTITLHNKSKIRVVAVNKELYEGVLEVLKARDIEISSVTPISVFPGRTNNQEFTTQDVRKISGNGKILQRYNFLQSKDNSQADEEVADVKDEPEEEEIKKKSMRSQYILLAISLILLTTAITYLLLWSNTISNPWFKKSESITPKPTTAVTPTTASQPSPTINPLDDKSVIKIQILNGSGIEGQAGKLSDLLKEAGYDNIITGNTEDVRQRTTIIYNKLLSKDMLNEITETISSDFPDPTLQEATQSAEYDILITTGEF